MKENINYALFRLLVAGWAGADTLSAAKKVLAKDTSVSGVDEKVLTTVTGTA